MRLRELGWYPDDALEDVRGGRLRRRDDLDIFYPNSEDRVYYPRNEYGNTSYMNCNEYPSGRPYVYDQSSYYDQQYMNSYQNREVHTNFYRNARFNNRRDYSQRSARSGRKRFSTNNYSRIYKQARMAPDKIESAINAVESPVVSKSASEDRDDLTDQCIDLTDLSDAETVHLGHEDDEPSGLSNTGCDKICTKSFAITDSQGTSVNIEVQTNKTYIVDNHNDNNEKKNTEENILIPLNMPLLTEDVDSNTLNLSKLNDNLSNTASTLENKENDKVPESSISEHKCSTNKFDESDQISFRKRKKPPQTTLSIEKNKKVHSTDTNKEHNQSEHDKKICKSNKDKRKSCRDSTSQKLGSGSKQPPKSPKPLKGNTSERLVTETNNEQSSDVLFSNEDINKLNNKLANLEQSDRSHENLLDDMEVEQIMCNSSSQPENITSTHRMITRSRARGKSCIPFERTASESKLKRSKSLQATDFLCYTPFRITRSISRNFLLSPGIVDESIQKIFDRGSDIKTKPGNIKKRRQTIDISEIPKKKPSLFSEQTPYVKPQEIEFSYTPRSSDVYYIEDSHEPQNVANVTVIYNATDSSDPRRNSGASNAQYSNNKDVKFTNCARKVSNSPQQNETLSRDVPKKIGNRRKSSTAKCNDDPDYVPNTRIAVTPRSSLTGNNESDCISTNQSTQAPQDTALLVRRNTETTLNDASATRKHVGARQTPAITKNVHLENEKKTTNTTEGMFTTTSTKVNKRSENYKPSSNCVKPTSVKPIGRNSMNTKGEKVSENCKSSSNCVQESASIPTRRNSTNAKVEKVSENYKPGSNCVQQPGMTQTRRLSTSTKVPETLKFGSNSIQQSGVVPATRNSINTREKVLESYKARSNCVRQLDVIPTKKNSSNTKDKVIKSYKSGSNCVQLSGLKSTRRDLTNTKVEKVPENNKVDSICVQQSATKAIRRNSTNTKIRYYDEVVQSIVFIEGVSTAINPEKRIERRAILLTHKNQLVSKDAINVQNAVSVNTTECKTNHNTLPMRRASLEPPLLEPDGLTLTQSLRTILDELGNYFCIIKTLNDCYRNSTTQYRAMTIPDALKGWELIAANDFYCTRIRHWGTKFCELCETLNPEICSARIFVYNLMLKVRMRDASTKYGVFLLILNMIIHSPLALTKDTPFMQAVRTHVTDLIIVAQTAAYQERTANISSASAVSSTENLKTSTSTTTTTSAVQQTSHPSRSSTTIPPTSPRTKILTDTQFQVLKDQVDAYNNIVRNYKWLTRMRLLADNRATTTSSKTRSVDKNLSQILQLVGALGSSAQKKAPPNAVPSILTVAQINERLNRTPVLNSNTENPLRKRLVRCTNDTIPPPLTILANDNPTMILPPPYSLSMKATTMTETINSRQNVDLNLTLQSVTTGAPSQVRGDVNCRVQSNNQEFVDLESYFNHVETLLPTSQAPSINNKNLEIRMQDVSVPVRKEVVESTRHRKVSDVSQDLPPRTASNDSGMDSPTQVDSSIYENRICLCGRLAVYVCPCKAIMYCSDACQRLDWDVHKDSYEHRSIGYLHSK